MPPQDRVQGLMGAVPAMCSCHVCRREQRLWGHEVVGSTLQPHQKLLTALTHVPSPRVKSPPCRRHGNLTLQLSQLHAAAHAKHCFSQQVLLVTGHIKPCRP